MNDLFQSTVGRDEFQEWLGLGTAPFTIWQGEKAVVTLSRLEKNPSVDYLYRIGVGKDNSISWNSNMQFCGVYDRNHRALYLTQDSLRILMDEYIYATTFLTGEQNYTLAAGLYALQATEMSGSWPVFAAASITVSLPVLVIFFLCQKHMTSGLTAGGVKG